MSTVEPIHLDQEALTAGLLTFDGILASAKNILFIGARPFDSCEASISPEMEVFFRVSLEQFHSLSESSGGLSTAVLSGARVKTL